MRALLAGLRLFTGSKIEDIPKECSENFIEYIIHHENGKAKRVNSKIF